MKTLLTFIGSALEVLLVDGAAFLLRELWHVAVLMFRKEALGKPVYDAKFEDHAEVSRWNKGYSINGNQYLSLEMSTRSVLCCGVTGTYKTAAIAVPSLLRLMESGCGLVVFDPQKQLSALTSGFAHSRQYEITHFNPNEPSGSAGFNHLLRASSTSDMRKLAHLLTVLALGKSQKDPFWALSAENLLYLMIRLVKALSRRELHHFGNVLQLLKMLGANAKLFDRLVLVAARRDSQLLTDYKSFLSTGENTRTGIISTAVSAVQAFEDERLRLVTSWDGIPFERLRERHVLYVTIPPLQADYYQFTVSVLFDQIMNQLMNDYRGVEDEKGYCFLCLDEMHALHLPNTLPSFLAMARKTRTGTLGIVQALPQIESVYGKDAQAIVDNFTTQIYLGASAETAQKLEAILGQVEYEDEKGRTQVRPLMDRQRLRTMERDKAVVLFSGASPSLSTVKPYFDSKWKAHAGMNPHAPVAHAPFEQAPMLTETVLENLLANGGI